MQNEKFCSRSLSFSPQVSAAPGQTTPDRPDASGTTFKEGCPLSHQTVIVLDFGGQYNQLIARRVRECSVYCELLPCTAPPEQIKAADPIGIIFSGGPASVYQDHAPRVDPAVFELGIPILGICYGCQLMAQMLGGQVMEAQDDFAREYGRTATRYDTACPLFRGLPERGISWMSHGDYMARVPAGFSLAASTRACPSVAIADEARRFYGVQFHPEVHHTQHGTAMLRNFLVDVCGARCDWRMADYRTETIRSLREAVGEQQVLLALSGGTDSAVTAALLSEAVGQQLTCVFVDHGLLRQEEGQQIRQALAGWDLRLAYVHAEERFLAKLEGVTDPERKRRLIGEEFIRVFEEEAAKLGSPSILAQGTIYSDVIESGTGEAARIKSHHNVGGLPENIRFQTILEPLRPLFKDEVRQLGRTLGLPARFTEQQPFPGPGLAVRIIGAVTAEKVRLLQQADAVFRQEVERLPEEERPDQYFAVLTDSRSVGVMGDGRTYACTVALRAVNTTDFMSADWARLPAEVLDRTATRIVNEVRGINRVVYDVTGKPPATIEWE